MSDQRLRDLERAVLDGGDEGARVALDAERRRRGMPSLWGYAPRWCAPSDKAPTRHLPGVQWNCAECMRAQAEVNAYISKNDRPTNGSRWTGSARAYVACVVRVASGLPLRAVREALREVRPSKYDAAHARKVFTVEVVRAFPQLARKVTRPLGPEDSPLFAAREVPRG